MIIFTSAPTMTMLPAGNPTDVLGVVATTDAPDGASPPDNTMPLGRLEMMQLLQRMIQAIRPGIFPVEHTYLFEGLLARLFLFQQLWYAALMGRWHGIVVDPRN
jgi:hypothetical protein